MPQGPQAKTPAAPADELPPETAAISRRQFVTGAGATGFAAATGSRPLQARATESSVSDGTPEQIHLTWGQDPTRTVHVSWASPGAARNPRVHVRAEPGGVDRIVPAEARSYTDGLSGETVFTYHATLAGLEPGALVHYTVSADNDRRAGQPFGASFRTAPRGRAPFRFTSYGDLATPNTAWALSSPQSRHAVAAVERFAPLFHLLNGDLCYANLNPHAQPGVWADFGNNVQTSAAQRPWMPCTGNHEIEFGNGTLGLDSYLTRFRLPDNGTAFPGCWYSFQIGAVLFISLSADDVIYQESGAFVPGPDPLLPAASTGNAPIPPGSSLYLHGYSGGAQTRWLEETLARSAAADVDWIVVQMHQDALSSSKHGNGCDKGIRDAWLPLFDRYGVDLVLCGHDHDYERSWPVRGCNHDAGRDAASGARVDTRQPRPVLTAPPADGVFDTSQGTIHFVLGGGGTSSPVDRYGENPLTGRPQAKVITRRNAPRPSLSPGSFVKPGPDALEEAIWSARRDTDTGYGIAVFDVDPGVPGGKTTITIAYYHAPGADREPNPHYELFETIVVAKQRRDAR